MTDTLNADIGDMLFGDLPAEETVENVAEQPPAQESEPQVHPESVAETPQEPVQGKQTEEQPKDHVVPLAVMLEEKFKARDLKQENERLRQQLEASKSQAQPVAIPDPYEDPLGYQSYIQSQIDDRAFNVTAEISGRFAEQKYGKEVVQEAIAWAQEQGQRDPYLGQRVRASNDPVGFVVEQFQREQFWTKYGSDPSALSALVAAPGTAAPQAMAAPAAPKPQAPPKSLVNAPSTGAGVQAIPEGAVLGSLKLNLD